MKNLLNRTVLVLLTAGNLALSGYTLVRCHASKSPTASITATPEPMPAPVGESTPVAPSAVQPPAAQPGLSATPVAWSQLESTDYETFIANLRRIGCPETTVRDIVKADVHALYEHKRSALPQMESGPFWSAGFGVMRPDPQALAQLEQEEQAVLQRLLGPAGAATDTTVPGARVTALRLAPSLEPKRVLLEQWWQRFESAKDQLLFLTAQRDLSEPENAQLQALETEQAQALETLLTPAEHTEFELRNSPAAQYVRQRLNGLEVSEEEFRSLVAIRQGLNQQLEQPGGSDQIAAALEKYDAAVTQVLGPERQALFQRDPEAPAQPELAVATTNGQESK